jgi:hypothetical protein
MINMAQPSEAASSDWLDLDSVAHVEVASEDPGFAIEAALEAELSSTSPGWRASEPGEQLIRLLFDRPQRLQRINLRFDERDRERTQEFVLRWSSDGRTYRELLRQQWNFNPVTANRQFEDYTVDLNDVAILELRIIPDISGGDGRASLTAIRLA